MLAPLRLKIKPLPPRPSEGVTPDPPSCTIIEINASSSTANVLLRSSSSSSLDDACAASTVGCAPASATSHASESSNSSSESSSRVSPPPSGYPNLPPGYTLTQPMLQRPSSDKTSASPTTAGDACSRRKSDGGSAGCSQQFSKCDVCGETGGVTNTVSSCDECHKAYHFNCLEPPLKKTPKRRGYSWYCEDCEPSK
ncbi:bromodomain testis-specific protein-like isoform X1 [Hyalella azteca]|uniref:Bromodomain testis-specific protein-like isoform X1 n=1 Tax=Hyalella azteca TaxID=294128 RepID=A0A8B7NF73_HYAAZ|nr:bromodomain testis-specific protein-like isoform X1 [Hyalella azteca]